MLSSTKEACLGENEGYLVR